MAITQNYIIYEQRRGVSRYGGPMITVKMIGVTDELDYVTYIDPSNFNSQKWIDVTSKPGGGFLIQGLEVKKDKIINADSNFVVLAETITPEPILAELNAISKQRREKKTETTFRDLFE
jgi:hypothetical protein